MPVTGSTITNTTITQTVTLGPGPVSTYPTYASPLTITSTGTVDVNSTTAGVVGILGPAGTAWTVTNLGTVESVGSLGLGIDLLSGGLVTNGSISVATATIIGSNNGINVGGASGTVVNYGTILSTATGANGKGIYLSAGGTVTNLGIIHGNDHGVLIAGGTGTVVNSGSISTTVALHAGGAITNTGTGEISSVHYAVVIKGSTGTLSNSGMIVVTSATAGEAVYLGAGGAVTNHVSGTISAVRNDVVLLNVAGMVQNYGLIENTGTNTAIYDHAGGTVTNAAGATIVGGKNGISVGGAAGTVTNSGTIEGTGTLGDAIYLGKGGTVTNSGLITGELDGVRIANASGSVINLGTIEGTSPSGFQVTGVALYGGSITNGAGTATTALISGVQYGAEIANTAGTILNFGSIVATGTGGEGLRLVSGGTIDNRGTITGPGTGVFLDSATTLTNGKSGVASGYISGQTGVNMQTTGTVTNFGRIVGAAAGSGLYFVEGGTVHNFGTIAGGAGVDFAFLNAGGIVVNEKSGSAAGLITGDTDGVSIETSGGTVTNFATITGGTDGVHMFGSVAVVVNNSGTINGGSDGAYLGGIAGAKVVNSGTINGGAEGVHTRDAAATVTNSGTGVIKGGTGNAVNLTDGGTVTNRGTILSPNATQAAINISNAPGSVNNSGSISGGTGILFGAGGTVTNTGTISGTGAHRTGVYIESGGSVANLGAVAVIEGYRGVEIAGAAGTVINTGTIYGTGTAFSIASVYLKDGGSVKNLGTASLIRGTSLGVYIYGTVGTVTNFGTIIGSTDRGVALYAGGTVINSGGMIGGYDKGVEVYGTLGTVINSGTITGSVDDGVALYAGGVVTNQPGGSIAGAGTAGVEITGGTGAVVNSGAIEGTGAYSAGVALLAGGSVSNALGGVVEGPGGGIQIAGSAGTIVNLGTIESTDTANHSSPFRDAISLYAGGSVINGQNGSNAGLIATGAKFGGGVDIRGNGSVTNYGTIAAAGTQSFGIVIGGSGTATVSNFGTIVDTGRYNYYVVALFGGGTVANFGTIVEMPGVSNVGFDRYSDGVYSRQGGLVTNGQSGATAGLISAAQDGVYIRGGVGTVVNFGTISGTGTNGTGITLQTGGTVVDSGTITGASGTAISFGGASANRLILEPGYHLGGQVIGSTGLGATNTLELGSAASAGTVLAAFASEFVNFGAVTVDVGAQWTLTGAISLAGVTLTDFGTLTIAGSLSGGSLIVDPASLVNTGSIGTTVTLAGGSYLDNKPTGRITVAGTAVYGTGAAATIVNAGKITGSGTGGYGVDLTHGGRVTNATVAARIAANKYGILISGAAGSVSNRGSVASSGGTGVSLFAGSVTNGATNAIGAAISAYHFGVQIQNSTGTVINFGSITSSGDTGIWLHAGTVINGPSGATHALISGPFDGVFIAAGRGTVVNYGTVTGGSSNDGVCLYAGGRVSNGLSGATTALISGYAWGVEVQNRAGTVINFGTVESTGTAGFTSGVFLKAGGTVTDAGTIRGASGTAISFGGTTANRLILDPGYHLGGTVVGSASAGATNTLELGPGAATGTVSSVIATEFVHFGAVKVDAGAHWVLTSNNTIAAGHTLTVNGRLTDLGTLTNAGVINGSGQLIVDPATLVNSGSIGVTVTLAGGGYLDNKTTGKITAARNAVYGFGGAATVANYGTISEIGTAGGNAIYLGAGGRITNHGTVSAVASTGTNGSHGVYLHGGGTITNFGTIAGAGSLGFGLFLDLGGRVTNRAGGSIAGGRNGVAIYGAAGTVTNAGMITGAATSGQNGVGLYAGGSVTNQAGGTITGSGFAGVFVYGIATVTNGGVISGSSGEGISGEDVGLSSGRLTNQTGGQITGYDFLAGIYIFHGAGTVANFGTIKATSTSGDGIRMAAGGSIANEAGGTITGGHGGVVINGSAGTVANSGRIVGTRQGGVILAAGGTVVDAGTISGGNGTAISFGGTGASRLVLDPGYHLGGEVVGSATAGASTTLELAAAASVGTLSGLGSSFVNFGTVTLDAGAQWVLGGNNTIGTAGTLKNSGTLTLAGTLVDLGALTNAGVITGGELIVDPATLVNSGSIGVTVTLAGGGYLDNKATGKITAAGNAVYGVGGAATVVNDGQITGASGAGVRLTAGGRVTNQSSGSITGGFGGVYILGGAGTLSNSGTISGGGGSTDGVYLNAGGVVSNSGVVRGLDGVDLRNAGTVTNSGTIIGSGSGNVGGIFLGFNYSAGAFRVKNTGSVISSATGVLMRGAGTITNGSSGATGATISGSIGVEIVGTGVATIVNFGTITGTGGIEIGLGAGNARVVIEQGSVLHGAVAGFHPGDTFDLPFMSFSSAGTVTLKSGNVLRVVENGGTFNIKLDPGQNFTGDFFHLAVDGGGGTLVTENHTPPAPYAISPNPASVLDNAGHLTFTITRSDASGPAVVYASIVQDQGFTNNGDYTFVNDTEVNFAAGVASVKVSVGITDTGAASGSEVFRFIIQQHKTDPVSTSLASDKFTITNTTAPAAAATPQFTFADIAPTGLVSGATNSGSPSNYLPGAIAANEEAHAGGQLLIATGHSGGTLLSLAGGANHSSLLPA